MNKNNWMKFLTACTSVIVATSVATLNADAAITIPHTIDNDPTASSGNSATQTGFSYISNNSCYNGDARIAATGNNSYVYNWIHETTSFGGTKTVTVKLQVYLNHSQFTDPSASYSVYRNGPSITIGTINQNLASSGWNSFASLTASNFTQLKFVSVDPSTYSGYNTGADAVSVTYTY